MTMESAVEDNYLVDFASIDNILKLSQLLPIAETPSRMGPAMPPVAVTPAGPGIAMEGGYGPVLSLPYAQPPAQSQAPAVKTKAPTVGAESLDAIRKWIRRTESSDNYQAKNKTTTASGGYQYVNGTWNNYGGYPEARLAPKAVQDAKMNEDLARRLAAYRGDPFKIIAAHYLPKFASDPSSWGSPHRLGKHVVEPTADYVRKVVRGTPLESQFNDYLRAHGIK